jgi:large subunit ribosomal protein L4e
MTTRPLVGVHSSAKGAASSYVPLPAVFTAPIRSDIVNDVYHRLCKNRRQPYAVSKYAGHQTSAESWGTGRAVARIPRVSGGGTHRAGQGAFGNMCRGGRMFAPTKIWRRWHRMSNQNERRYAIASAVAATGIPALVMAKGHRVANLPEIPLVVDNKALDGVDKTKGAVKLLKELGAYDDVQRVIDSQGIRSGKGKARNRRYTQAKGPLVIFAKKGKITRAFRNLPGVDFANVRTLNLLNLAPGGHLGRFVIWTKDAFEHLNSVFGTYRVGSSTKKGYHLPSSLLSNPDVGRIVNSDEIQSVLRPKRVTLKTTRRHGNPLKNFNLMVKLNPYASVLKRRNLLSNTKNRDAKLKKAAKKH